MSKAKYTTMEDTAHRTESKQVDEEQHHPVAKQLCKEVHYMVECQTMSETKYSTVKDTVTRQVCEDVNSRVECMDMAGQECKHATMENWLDWENKVTEWDERLDAMTLLCMQEVDGPAGWATHSQP